MPPYSDLHASKKATNLSINSDLLAKTENLDIDLSVTLEQALVAVLRERKRAQWLADNKEAIRAYNECVEINGVFSEGLRSFRCGSRLAWQATSSSKA